jgi:hypothetical protein
VRHLFLMLFLFSSCSSWEQKEFEKDLGRSSEDVQPELSVSLKDQELLEKFQVKTVEKEEISKAPDQKKNALVTKKPTPKESAKDVGPVKKAAEKTSVPRGVPKDFPEEMISINARAQKVWEQYKPNHRVDDKLFLDIHFLGMTVGKIMAVNKGKKVVNGKEVWHFHARFKSAPFYSNIYELDDTVDTFVTTDGFLSNRYSLIQRESKQDVDDLQIHDRDQYKTFWFYQQKKKGKEKKNKNKESYIPYFSIDPFSVLFFYQGLPLKTGDLYEIPVINKAKILILRSVVEARESIDTEKGRRKAIRVHATTKYTGETLKSGELYFWFSDDDRRQLLKVQAKISLGSVTADIVD